MDVIANAKTENILIIKIATVGVGLVVNVVDNAYKLLLCVCVYGGRMGLQRSHRAGDFLYKMASVYALIAVPIWAVESVRNHYEKLAKRMARTGNMNDRKSNSLKAIFQARNGSFCLLLYDCSFVCKTTNISDTWGGTVDRAKYRCISQ